MSDMIIDNYVFAKKGLVKLIGRRIVGVTTQEVAVEKNGEPVEIDAPQGHRHSDEEHAEHGREESYIFMDLENVDDFFDVYSPLSYYDFETKTVHPMKAIPASLSKESIINDGKDSVKFTIKTTEPLDITVSHMIASEPDGYMIRREPVKGKISVTISSELVGTTRITTMGETVYSEPIEFKVEVGDQI